MPQNDAGLVSPRKDLERRRRVFTGFCKGSGMKMHDANKKDDTASKSSLYTLECHGFQTCFSDATYLVYSRNATAYLAGKRRPRGTYLFELHN